MKVIIEIPDEVAKKNHPKSYFDYFGAWSLNLTKTFRKAVFLPSGHGDLIDRQAIIDNGIEKGFCDWYDEIKYAPTVIEADQENKE